MWLLAATLLLPAASIAQSGRRQQTSSPVIVSPAPQSPSRPRSVTDSGTGGTGAQDTSASSGQPKTNTAGKGKNQPEEVGADDVVKVTSNLVTVPASVVDSDGVAVANLRLEDFELLVDGQKKIVSDLYRSETPVRLALLFDNSSSLTASRDLERQAAIRFFRRVMRPQDQAAVYNVYNEVELSQPLTSDVHALIRTIESFGKPEGATSLFDAIAEAAKYLSQTQGRKVIVIVSDGADTTSQLDFDTTLRRAQVADCQIYVVQTGQSKNANLRDLMAERRMEDFAAQTGGAVYVPLNNADLDMAFDQISADLATQYVLSYYPKDDARDGRFRVISLRVPTRPNARVRARKGYYSPKEKKA
jgi:Ca-activated chloride channel family protein